jgi:protein CpxP
MAYIKNNKVLVLIIAILLLSNIGILYFFTRKDCKKQDKPQEQSFRQRMIQRFKNEVGFTDDQIAKYEALSNKHKEAMKPLFDSLIAAKDSLYKMLMRSPNDSLFNNYLVDIGERQEKIDLRIYNHFAALRELCTAEQLPKYDTVIQKVIWGMITFPNNKKDSTNKKVAK